MAKSTDTAQPQERDIEELIDCLASLNIYGVGLATHEYLVDIANRAARELQSRRAQQSEGAQALILAALGALDIGHNRRAYEILQEAISPPRQTEEKTHE